MKLPMVDTRLGLIEQVMTDPRFRVSAWGAFWTARIQSQNVPGKQQLKPYIQRAGDGLNAGRLLEEHVRISGAFTKDRRRVDLWWYNFTYYPRKRVPPPTIEKCYRSANALCRIFENDGIVYKLTLIDGIFDDERAITNKRTGQLNEFRVFVGLDKGYKERNGVDKDSPPDYSVSFVQQQLGDQFEVEQAEICSYQIEFYLEPAVVIYGRMENLGKVLELLITMHQERATIEWFQVGISFTLENIAICKIPDK